MLKKKHTQKRNFCFHYWNRKENQSTDFHWKSIVITEASQPQSGSVLNSNHSKLSATGFSRIRNFSRGQDSRLYTWWSFPAKARLYFRYLDASQDLQNMHLVILADSAANLDITLVSDMKVSLSFWCIYFSSTYEFQKSRHVVCSYHLMNK